MNEREILLSRCLDAKKRANDNCMITNTPFLSADERSVIQAIYRDYISDIETFCYGGYGDAERCVAFFVPKCFGVEDIELYFSENEGDMPFELIKITKDRFSVLSHRDYLGSIMGLGIKRETVGDIVITDECAYVFAMKSVSAYICDNLIKSGRGTVKCEICSLSAFDKGKENTELVFSSVASLRLDNVIAAAFNLSRSTASQSISNGLVYVNSLQNFKPDFTVREKDKLVLRGRGKAVVDEIIGESKKGRIHINIKKFR